MTQTYWRDAVADQAMQDEHGFIWKAMLDTVDVDLVGKRVLDAGCNRGAFLRLLVDGYGIAEGFGYDPASGAVDDAKRLADRRRLHFQVAETVPADWGGFEVAFSHEVLYLLHDIPAHARAMFTALEPGAVYYAVMGVHAGSPVMEEWHRANAEELQLPRLYDLDEVVSDFHAVGFDAAVARLAVRFIPTGGRHHEHGRVLDWVNYFSDQKVLLRFGRPIQS
jgi:SAM-dependent methyltransferase